MKDVLITSGFPRSGNTYLNQALNLLYYPDQEVNWNGHTVRIMEESSRIIVPFRNPVDAIASWHRYPSDGTLEADSKFYIRFYSYVLDNLHKIVLMDFDYFTKDLEYIKDKVFKNFGFENDNQVTDSEIRAAMLADGKHINLPRNNKAEIDSVKEQLVKEPLFEQCIELYNKLKEQ